MNGSISTETFNLIKFVNKRIILFNCKLHKKEIEEIHAIEIKNKNYTGIQFNMRREKENSTQLLKYFHFFIQHSSILVYFDPNDFKILQHSLKKQNLRISLESFCLQVSLTIFNFKNIFKELYPNVDFIDIQSMMEYLDISLENENFTNFNSNLFQQFIFMLELYSKCKFKNENSILFLFQTCDEGELEKFFSKAKVKVVLSMKPYTDFQDLILKFDKTPCLGLETLCDIDQIIKRFK
jgi:hypothetical protein